MKTLYKILFSLLGVAVLLTACDDEILREPSPVQQGGVQAFFSADNETSYSFLPDATPVMNVVVGRNITTGADSVAYIMTDENGVFVPQDDKLFFPAGVAYDTLVIDCSAMTLGMNAELVLTLNEEDAYVYAASSISISVLRDYKWVNRGAVEYNDLDFGLGAATVPIQQAEGTQLFRLPNLYNYFDEEIPTGFHLLFYIDTTTFAAINLPAGFQDLGTGYEVYYNTTNYGAYCTFTSSGNEYFLGYILTPDRSALYIGGASFVWKEGFPGVMTDPYEGEGVDSISWNLTNPWAIWYADYYYNEVSEFDLVLDDGSNYVNLVLFADLADETDPITLPEGEYKINQDIEVGTALAGYNGANGKDGTYAFAPSVNSTFYLVEGTVTVTEELGVTTINVEALSASNVSFRATWSGALSVINPFVNNGQTRAATTPVLYPRMPKKGHSGFMR